MAISFHAIISLSKKKAQLRVPPLRTVHNPHTNTSTCGTPITVIETEELSVVNMLTTQ